MKTLNRHKRALALSLLIASFTVLPGRVYADHPGIIGPVTHLGPDTVIRVILAALLDGVNPTALGVLLYICSRSRQGASNVRRQVFLFLSGLISTYVLAGAVLRITYGSFGPSLPIQIFQILIAGFLFISGLQELQHALRPESKKVTALPVFLETMSNRLNIVVNTGLTFVLGAIVGVLELFATGAIYLSFMQAVTYDSTAPWWVSIATMAIYLVVFLVPLLVAFSYRGILVGEVIDKNFARVRKARAITGIVFMIAALFIAASSIVTIQAIGV